MKKNKKISLIVIVIAIMLIIGGIILIFIGGNSTQKKNIKKDFNYANVGPYREGYLSVSNGKKYGYVNSSGDVIFPLDNDIPTIFEEKSLLQQLYFTDGVAPYINDSNLFGLIDTNGKIIVEASYVSIKVISKDCIIVKVQDGSYIINSKGERAFDEYYDEIISSDGEQSNFVAVKDDKYGVIDTSGKKLLDLKYDLVEKISDENTGYIYTAKNKDEYEVYDSEGKALDINNCIYVSWYHDGKINYQSRDGKNHIYDTSNKKDQVYDSKYQTIQPFSEGLASVTDKEMNVGYIDETGREVIALKYFYEGSTFKDGLAVVKKKEDDKITAGVIDKSDKTIIDFEYDNIHILSKNRFVVTKNDESYIVDENNKVLSDKYYNIYEDPYSDNFIVTVKDDKELKYGVMNSKYKIIYDTKYLNIVSSEDGLVLQESDNKYIVEQTKKTD